MLAADEFGDLAVAFNAMQHGLREREALHAAFGSYVDPLLAQRLIESGSSVFEGEEVEVTVLFADVRDFTVLLGGRDAGGGGGAAQSLFDVVGAGAPRARGPREPLPGRRSAGGVRRAAALGAPCGRGGGSGRRDPTAGAGRSSGTTLHLGIGINTGPVIAGTVGGGGRHEFTVIGDTVNAAARVEQLTKETGDAILITEATRRHCPRPDRGRPSGAIRGSGQGGEAHAACHEPVATIDPVNRALTLSADLGFRW